MNNQYAGLNSIFDPMLAEAKAAFMEKCQTATAVHVGASNGLLIGRKVLIVGCNANEAEWLAEALRQSAQPAPVRAQA